MDTIEFDDARNAEKERNYDRIVRLNLERTGQLVDDINECLDRTDGVLNDLKPEVERLSEQTRHLESESRISLERTPDVSANLNEPNLSVETIEPETDFDLDLG